MRAERSINKSANGRNKKEGISAQMYRLLCVLPLEIVRAGIAVQQSGRIKKTDVASRVIICGKSSAPLIDPFVIMVLAISMPLIKADRGKKINNICSITPLIARLEMGRQ